MPDPSPDWWRAISPYLDEALAMSGEERDAWLAVLGERDPSLARRLEGLLEEHQVLARNGFLERGPSAPSSDVAVSGRMVGAYALRTPIGEGGMGSVWLAERADGEIQQRVAVKLLGAASLRSGWRERFLRERQLLSSLNHPSIVHVIDAGRTDAGQPYLVMEYVDGRSIDVHAAEIPVRDRLELFLHVCDAVSHAHQRLIIHRDLKPSNILVDAAGQPKLLDFGIAKLLDDSSNPTLTIERLLTPAYASPEQFRGDSQTTATDIYSLGAVLYHLLTGRPPHEPQTAASRAADRRMPAAEIPAPTHLNAALPSDADFIVRKALRDEPSERYASVEAFAHDVRALLESRPIDARAGDVWYRARKFVRRYWVPVTTAALVIASLSIGLYFANRERAIARRRFDEVRQLANRFIALDAEIRNLPGATQARNHIVSESLEYLARLGPEARGDADLSLEIGNAYLHVAEVQGVPAAVGNLGRFTAAESQEGRPVCGRGCRRAAVEPEGASCLGPDCRRPDGNGGLSRSR